MGKNRDRRKDKGLGDEQFCDMNEAHPRQTKSNEPIKAQTEAQGHYLISIQKNVVTFGVGPAGTGKTWVAAALAAQMLEEKRVQRIIITRPTEEAGRGLGYLPGLIGDKFEPFFSPVRQVFYERLGASATDFCLKRGKIQILPLEHMRGHTFDNAFVLLDEAQNTTPVQMKLFLTRIGQHATVVVNGDLSQRDIQGETGLSDALGRITDVPGVEVVRFEVEDIVRSGIVREILLRYDS